MQKAEKKIKAIVFDLGYTLIYFDGDFEKIALSSYLVLADELISAGYDIDRQKFAERFFRLMHRYYEQRENDLLELPIERLVTRAVAEFSQVMPTKAQIVAAMNKMYLYTEEYWQLENDTHAALMELRESGYLLGMISNASSAWDVNNLIDRNDLRKYFSTILISAEEGIRKPDRCIFEKAAQKLESDLTEMVMVGDTLNADIYGARQCGMKSVWISRRAEEARYLLEVHDEFKPDAEIHTLLELPSVLESL
jgi:HAD superfamily hydrolase (TIGR01662 family)